MDEFLTFLSNYYIWFLVAAGVFLFALVGLIIESSKKHKKDKENTDNDEVGTVESFRSGASQEDSSASKDNNKEISYNNESSPILDLGVTPSLEDNRSSIETPSIETSNEVSDTNSLDATSISFETPSFDVQSENRFEEVPNPETPSFEITDETPIEDSVEETNETQVEENNVNLETPSIEDDTNNVSTVEEIPAPETPTFEIVDDVVDADSIDNAEDKKEDVSTDDIMSIPSLDNVPAFDSVDVPDKVE